MNVAGKPEFRGKQLFDEPMSKHTSWRLGGPADRLEGQQQRLHRRRVGCQPHRDSGGDAQRALAADERPA